MAGGVDQGRREALRNAPELHRRLTGSLHDHPRIREAWHGAGRDDSHGSLPEPRRVDFDRRAHSLTTVLLVDGLAGSEGDDDFFGPGGPSSVRSPVVNSIQSIIG